MNEANKNAKDFFKPLSGKYDGGRAHVLIYPGVGGDDAKDWANMLLEMYSRYAKKRNWKVIQTDDRAIEVKGEYSYGSLKNESGVHRLVRISPFDSKKIRHTSFALVEVIPSVLENHQKELNIPSEDLKVELSKSSGPGGQNVNKRETAVRIVHIPTGIATSSQSERSQAQNREKALKLLKSKLIHMLELHQEQEVDKLKVHAQPKWGNQIRSYILHPYKMVKDHRTKVQSHKPEDVLKGDLDKFVEAELQLD